MTDERLCATCGGIDNMVVHAREFRKYHPFVPAPDTVEAAPSTDEGEAQDAIDVTDGPFPLLEGRDDRGRARWRYKVSPVDYALVTIPVAVEAAIRAPLEERITKANEAKEAFRQLSLDLDREKKALHEKWWHELELRADAEERIRELEAALDSKAWALEAAETERDVQKIESLLENARLREALRESVEVIDAYVEPQIKPFKVDEWRALATPPSSTEGTK